MVVAWVGCALEPWHNQSHTQASEAGQIFRRGWELGWGDRYHQAGIGGQVTLQLEP